MRLLRWTGVSGSIQCDSRCYNAKKKKCKRCICGGTNHGIGKEQAIVNTREHWNTWIQQQTGTLIYSIAPEVLYLQMKLPFSD